MVFWYHQPARRSFVTFWIDALIRHRKFSLARNLARERSQMPHYWARRKESIEQNLPFPRGVVISCLVHFCFRKDRRCWIPNAGHSIVKNVQKPISRLQSWGKNLTTSLSESLLRPSILTVRSLKHNTSRIPNHLPSLIVFPPWLQVTSEMRRSPSEKFQKAQQKHAKNPKKNYINHLQSLWMRIAERESGLPFNFLFTLSFQARLFA